MAGILLGIFLCFAFVSKSYAHCCGCSSPCGACTPQHAIPQWFGEGCSIIGNTRKHLIDAFDADTRTDSSWFNLLIDIGYKWDQCYSGASNGSPDDPLQKQPPTSRNEGGRKDFREWVVDWLFESFVNPAMMRMSQQFITLGMSHAAVIGKFFDAKHQLETQLLYDELKVEAIADYQPSEPLCRFGTLTRSLAATEQKAKTHKAMLSDIAQKRHLSNRSPEHWNNDADRDGRLRQFANVYCDKTHMGGHLVGAGPDVGEGLPVPICLESGGTEAKRYSKDANYTKSIDVPLTLDMNLLDNVLQEGEEDVLAMAANLFGHIPADIITVDAFKNPEVHIKYLDLRSFLAKRSVAENSFFSIASMKAKGVGSNFDHYKDLFVDFGYTEDDAEKIIGKEPSYYGQMEVLTKKLYQNPNFYTGAIDGDANIDRQEAAIQAFELMQQRDFFESMLRQEMVLSVMLEELLRTRSLELQRNMGESTR